MSSLFLFSKHLHASKLVQAISPDHTESPAYIAAGALIQSNAIVAMRHTAENDNNQNGGRAVSKRWEKIDE